MHKGEARDEKGAWKRKTCLLEEVRVIYIYFEQQETTLIYREISAIRNVLYRNVSNSSDVILRLSFCTRNIQLSHLEHF